MACTNCKDSILNDEDVIIPDPQCQDDCPDDVGCPDTLSSGCVIYQGSDISCLDIENGDTLTEIIVKLGALCDSITGSITACKVRVNADDTCCDYLESKIKSDTLDVSVDVDGRDCKIIRIEEKDWTWTNINITNGAWVSAKTLAPYSDWATLQYGVKNDEVQLKGGLFKSSNTSNTLIFTLPLSIAPTEKKVYQGSWFQGSYIVLFTISIDTNGEVRIYLANYPALTPNIQVLISLDFIRYII